MVSDKEIAALFQHAAIQQKNNEMVNAHIIDVRKRLLRQGSVIMILLLSNLAFCIALLVHIFSG